MCLTLDMRMKQLKSQCILLIKKNLYWQKSKIFITFSCGKCMCGFGESSWTCKKKNTNYVSWIIYTKYVLITCKFFHKYCSDKLFHLYELQCGNPFAFSFSFTFYKLCSSNIHFKFHHWTYGFIQFSNFTIRHIFQLLCFWP